MKRWSREWWKARRDRREMTRLVRKFEDCWAEGLFVPLGREEGFVFFCELERLGETEVRRRLSQGVW